MSFMVPLAPPRLAIPKVADPAAANRLAALAAAVASRFGLIVNGFFGAPLPAAGWRLLLTAGTAPVAVTLDQPAMALLGPRVLGLLADYPMDDPVLAPLLEEALAPELAALEAALAVPLRLDAVSRFDASAATPDGGFLSLTVHGGPAPFALSLACPTPALLPAPSVRGAGAAIIARLPVRGWADVGGRTLRAAVWRGLAPGDVLVIATRFPANGAMPAVRLGFSPMLRMKAHFVDEDQLMIEGRDHAAEPLPADGDNAMGERLPPHRRPRPETPPATPETDTAPAGGEEGFDRLVSGRDLDQLPLDVRVDLGSVELTLRELRDLTPGAVLTLNRPVEAPAILRVNGNRIATAELVDVNGWIGARIVQLLR